MFHDNCIYLRLDLGIQPISLCFDFVAPAMSTTPGAATSFWLSGPERIATRRAIVLAPESTAKFVQDLSRVQTSTTGSNREQAGLTRLA
jgi:hypothetical protein